LFPSTFALGADGKELFYRSVGTGGIYSVEITTNPVFRPGTPRILFRSRFTGAGNFDRNPMWTPSSDGKQFIGMMNEADAAADPISVVLNWQVALKK
jgi:hypothetical protein